ncbi:MAG: hypothetical protein U5R31_00355 [Acidimicrobiia bacterium]|nr:hypothetical protein [Acidimicrobiia bacterium]
MIHFEQDPPVFEETAEENEGRSDDNVVIRESYLFNTQNLANLPEQATELIAKMQSAGVTTIVFIGDPIMPIYLTQEATAQDYHPEWIIPGVALTDTTQLAREYDPEQWDHAYGLSHLGARVPREQGDAWRLYDWYFGEGSAPPPSEATFGIIAANYQRLVLGIQMAGPELTAETFARGLFRVPPMGGGPTTPQISYGNWGFFEKPDYNGIDDAVPIWWDVDQVGPTRTTTRAPACGATRTGASGSWPPTRCRRAPSSKRVRSPSSTRSPNRTSPPSTPHPRVHPPPADRSLDVWTGTGTAGVRRTGAGAYSSPRSRRKRWSSSASSSPDGRLPAASSPIESTASSSWRTISWCSSFWATSSLSRSPVASASRSSSLASKATPAA